MTLQKSYKPKMKYTDLAQPTSSQWVRQPVQAHLYLQINPTRKSTMTEYQLNLFSRTKSCRSLRINTWQAPKWWLSNTCPLTSSSLRFSPLCKCQPSSQTLGRKLGSMANHPSSQCASKALRYSTRSIRRFVQLRNRENSQSHRSLVPMIWLSMAVDSQKLRWLDSKRQ